MTPKDLAEYKKKYHTFRHHAWAGLGFLSVVIAIRLLFPDTAHILTPVIVILAIYILVALIFTYKYRSGLSAEEALMAFLILSMAPSKSFWQSNMIEREILYLLAEPKALSAISL